MNHEAKWSEMKRHEATGPGSGSGKEVPSTAGGVRPAATVNTKICATFYKSFYIILSLYKSYQSTLLYFVTLCGTPKWHFQWLSEAALDKQFQEEEAATEEREKKKAFYALESWDPQEHSIALQNMK